VEKLFFQSAEFCSEHEVWKLNVAHVFFMQGKEILVLLVMHIVLVCFIFITHPVTFLRNQI
jgi:hypothetical protein